MSRCCQEGVNGVGPRNHGDTALLHLDSTQTPDKYNSLFQVIPELRGQRSAKGLNVNASLCLVLSCVDEP